MLSSLVFLSYSHADSAFADRLRSDLENIGVSVWHDRQEIRPGDSIAKLIENALQTCEYFILCLSENSSRSPWVEREYHAALDIQMRTRSPTIIPLRLSKVRLPPLLSDTKWVDFTTTYELGWKELSNAFPSRSISALRVGASTGTGVRVLNTVLARLRGYLPSQPIQEIHDISGEISKQVARQAPSGLDAGVVGEIPGEELRVTLEWTEICSDKVVLIVPPGAQLWGAQRVSEVELRNRNTQSSSSISVPIPGYVRG